MNAYRDAYIDGFNDGKEKGREEATKEWIEIIDKALPGFMEKIKEYVKEKDNE